MTIGAATAASRSHRGRQAFKFVKVSLNLDSQLEKQQSLTQRGGQEKFEAPQVSKNREKEANTREEVTRLSLSVKK